METGNLGSTPRALDHILYVEDEDVNWEVAELSLEMKYRLTRAKNAREAFEKMSKDKFAAILMDIQLQGSELNGIQITQVIKGLYAGRPPSYASLRLLDVPVIFVTAYSARYNKAELIAAGGVDMLVKPVNFTNLALVLSRVLSRGVLGRLTGSARPDTSSPR